MGLNLRSAVHVSYGEKNIKYHSGTDYSRPLTVWREKARGMSGEASETNTFLYWIMLGPDGCGILPVAP